VLGCNLISLQQSFSSFRWSLNKYLQRVCFLGLSDLNLFSNYICHYTQISLSWFGAVQPIDSKCQIFKDLSKRPSKVLILKLINSCCVQLSKVYICNFAHNWAPSRSAHLCNFCEVRDNVQKGSRAAKLEERWVHAYLLLRQGRFAILLCCTCQQLQPHHKTEGKLYDAYTLLQHFQL
jgi:hypothetical protein